VSDTVPAKEQVYAPGDDLANMYDMKFASRQLEYGEVVHLYFTSVGWSGELEDICTVWIGTPDREPVLLDVNGRYVAQEEAA
jgi:hypothetical protein